MPWYASTFEHFAVTPVRPAPPQRVENPQARRPKPQPSREHADSESRTR